MSLKELKKLRSDVDRAIKSASGREIRAARAAAEKALRKFGFSLKDLTDGAPKARAKSGSGKPKAAGSPKYRNPGDPKQTWTGKGRRPAWFVSAIEGGKTAADLEI